MQAFTKRVSRSRLFFFGHHHQRPVLMRCCLLIAFVVVVCGGGVLPAQRLATGRILPPSQEQSVDSLLKRLSSARDTARVEILNNLAWIYRGTDFGKAIQYAQQGAREAAALGYPVARAQNSNYLGIIYRNLGNYAKAMEYFVEARKIAEEWGYRREEGYALNNIGDIYKYERRYADARKYSMLSLSIFEQLRDSAGLYYCYIRLGEIAQNIDEFPGALQAFRQALSYAASSPNAVWKSGALNRIGQVYRLQGSYSDALKAFFPALAISSAAQNDEDEQALILIQIGKTYLATNQRDTATYYLQRGFDLAERIGVKQHIREASKTLAEIYSAQGNYSTAFRFQAIQMAMSDSLFSEAGRREIERLSAKYDMEKQQLALDALSAEQKQERFIGLALALGVVLLLVSAGLLYRNIRSERRANAEIVRQQRILEDQSTEIEMTNTTLQEQNRELEALNTEKTELMGIVAHDLKNPIGAVRGLAELVESDAVEGNDLHEAVKQIILTSDRMLALVTNILDSNRLELGGMKFSIVEFDILPVVEATCWQYTQAAEAKKITIHFLPEIPSAIVSADEQAVMQIMDNLLSNAVKYSPQDKNIFIRITNGTAKTTDKRVPHASQSIRLAVQDEGPGLSDDDKTKLFSKFARLSARPTGGEHSTGLGLSIVKKMVEALNGRVWCESELGKGATFIVELPTQQHHSPNDGLSVKHGNTL